MNSPLPQKKRKRGNLSWRFLLKRGCGYRELSKDDYPWLWAAYNKGNFEELHFEPEMSQAQFAERLNLTFDYFYDRNGTAVLCEAYSDVGNGKELVPVCLTLVDFSQNAFFPHVIWFEWATPRNIIESTVNFLRDLIKEGNVVIFSERKNSFFFSHMARYGILNRRGVLKKYFPDGGDAIIFQGVK